MGLLDFSFDNLDDPKKQMMLMMAAGLLQPQQQKGLGGALSAIGQAVPMGLQQYGHAQQLKAKMGQDELSKLATTQKILSDQYQLDRQDAIWTGREPPPVPAELTAIHQKLRKTLGLGDAAQSIPQQAAPQPTPTLPPSVASNYSPAVKPEFQAKGPMPQAPQGPVKSMSLMDFAEQVGIPRPVAAGFYGKPDKLAEKLVEQYAPHYSNGMVFKFNHDTKQIDVFGGLTSDASTITRRNPVTNELEVIPIKNQKENIAAREGARAGAIEEAKAGYNFGSYPTGPGGAQQVMSIQRLRQLEGTGQPQPAGNIPPEILAASKRGPFEATQEPGRPPQFITGGPGGGGLTGIAPHIAKQLEKDAEYFSKMYTDSQVSAHKTRRQDSELDRISNLLEGLETNKITPYSAAASSYLSPLFPGIDLKKVGNIEAADALSKEMALKLRNPEGGGGMPGNLSNSDRDYLASMAAGSWQLPGGRKLIIETYKKLNQRTREEAKIINDYKRSHGGILDAGIHDVLQKYADDNPLFPKIERNSEWSVKEVK